MGKKEKPTFDQNEIDAVAAVDLGRELTEELGDALTSALVKIPNMEKLTMFIFHNYSSQTHYPQIDIPRINNLPFPPEAVSIG